MAFSQKYISTFMCVLVAVTSGCNVGSDSKSGTGGIGKNDKNETGAVNQEPVKIDPMLVVKPIEKSNYLSPDKYRDLAKEILKNLVALDTTKTTGDTAVASEMLAKYFLDAGFPSSDVHVVIDGRNNKRGNLIVRLPGTDSTLKPLLLLAHIDVVEADPKDWTLPPFELIEKDGAFYGRGVADDKDEASIYTANLIRMKKEGYKPRRGIVLALTTDEEGGGYNGVRYLLEKHKDLIDPAFVFNEGGGGVLDDAGNRISNNVQSAEKKFQNYRIVARNPGGHSSRPRDDNAIIELSKALVGINPRLLPVKLNDVTREYLKRSAGIIGGTVGNAMSRLASNPEDVDAAKVLSKDPQLNAIIRSACAPTLLKGGHAANALPQRAEAVINCRLVPGEDPDYVLNVIKKATGEALVDVSIDNKSEPTPTSPVDGEMLTAITKVTDEMWPGVPVIPSMSTGATDSSPFRELGIPAYGVSGIFYGGETGAHGMNERVPVQSFYEGQEFLYRLSKAVTSE